MKTLDEVIAGMTELILSGKTDDVKYVLMDARSYLKKYKEKLSNDDDETAYKRGYSCGYAKAQEDEAVNRRWEESYRESQMPWNRGCEMGG